MTVKIFNKGVLSRIKPNKIVKKAGVILTAIALSINMVGCDVKKPNNNSKNTQQDFNYEINQNDSSEENKIPTLEHDTSEEYAVMFVGDGEDLSIGNSDNFLRYKDNDNAFTRNTCIIPNTNVYINADNQSEFMETLRANKVDIPYSDLFNIEHLLEKNVDDLIYTTHLNSFNLTNGKIDFNNLYNTVINNNSNYNLYGTSYFEYPNDKVADIVNIITKTLNIELENNPYIDVPSLCCNLGCLKILGEENVTNARITYDNVLAISNDMIESLKLIVESNKVDVYTQTIMHESMHIPQLNCDDEIDKTIGNKIGFNRKWNDEPINSLFWNWYYEASAELLTMNQTGGIGVVYENKVNYLKFLKMTYLPNPTFNINSIEEVSVSRNIDDFFDTLNLNSPEEKVELSKIMYTIEIIQNQNREFEKLYSIYKGNKSSTLTVEEWNILKRELKSALATNLSIIFYENLAKYASSKGATLYDVYRMITVYEAELEQHLLYDSTTRFKENLSFMRAYTCIQDAFFSSLNTDTHYDYINIKEGFNTYSINNDSLINNLSIETNDFLTKREKELIMHMTSSVETTYKLFNTYLSNEKTLNLD